MFEFLDEPIPITSQQWKEGTIPIVSISCITYNHENFIRDAIEGFLMQRTTFPVEILIHDDASTDKTAEIVREYEQKFPQLIKPIYQTENQYSKGIGVSVTYQYPRACGKYIALCEGDDYWTDPLKLQKQVDFLEANPEYGLVHTGVKVLNQTTGKIINKAKGDKRNSFNDFLIKNRIATLTVLFRKELAFQYMEEVKPETHNWKMGDYPMWLWFAYNSKIKLLPECTAVRRLALGSASNQKNKYKQINFFNSVFDIKMFFAEKYECDKEQIFILKKINANDKIKKAVLIQSYDLYKTGIADLKSLNIPIGLKVKLFGATLQCNFLKIILSKIISLRKNAL